MAPGGQLQLEDPHVLQLDVDDAAGGHWHEVMPHEPQLRDDEKADAEDGHLQGFVLHVLHIIEDDVDEGHTHGVALQVVHVPIAGADVILGQRQFAVPQVLQLAELA